VSQSRTAPQESFFGTAQPQAGEFPFLSCSSAQWLSPCPHPCPSLSVSTSTSSLLFLFFLHLSPGLPPHSPSPWGSRGRSCSPGHRDRGAGWGLTPGALARQGAAPETRTNPGVRPAPRPRPPALLIASWHLPLLPLWENHQRPPACLLSGPAPLSLLACGRRARPPFWPHPFSERRPRPLPRPTGSSCRFTPGSPLRRERGRAGFRVRCDSSVTVSAALCHPPPQMTLAHLISAPNSGPHCSPPFVLSCNLPTTPCLSFPLCTRQNESYSGFALWWWLLERAIPGCCDICSQDLKMLQTSQWLTPVIPATWEAEIERMEV
jgi:hypothetical protein